MGEKNAPLYSLTVEEHTKLLRETIANEFCKLLNEKEWLSTSNQIPDVIFLDDAFTLTGLKPATIYSKVSRGEMPALSRGRPLTFSRNALIKWMELGKPSIHDQRATEILSAKMGGKHE